MDWASLYPAYAASKDQESKESGDQETKESARARKAITQPVEIADIGCGYGGLLFALAPKFPNTLLIGRSKFLSISLPSLSILSF